MGSTKFAHIGKFKNQKINSEHLMCKLSAVYKDVRAQTERFRMSVIPFMIRMLNASESEYRNLYNKLVLVSISVNFGSSLPL